MQTHEEQYLSIGEASEYLGVSIDTLRRWAKKAKIPAYRSPGHHRYFKKSDLDHVFGTRYERSEPKVTKDLSQTFVREEEITDPVPQENQTPTTDSFSLTNILEEVSFPDSPNPVSPLRPTDIKQPLNVPRFIHKQNISKYDAMLRTRSLLENTVRIEPPEISGAIDSNSSETPKPLSVDQEKIESILVPKIPLQSNIQEVVREDPKPASKQESRIRVEEVMEEPKSYQEVTRPQSSIDKFLKKVFIAFLIIDAVMFFFWFTSNRLFTPLP